MDIELRFKRAREVHCWPLYYSDCADVTTIRFSLSRGIIRRCDRAIQADTLRKQLAIRLYRYIQL